MSDAAGPAGSLFAELASVGLDVRVANTREYAQACGGFFDSVVEGTLAHPDQVTLNAAVAAADRRIVAEAWLWSRRASTADISPLVAATLALWAHRQNKPKPQILVAWA